MSQPSPPGAPSRRGGQLDRCVNIKCPERDVPGLFVPGPCARDVPGLVRGPRVGDSPLEKLISEQNPQEGEELA